jgi:hypothetical protein
LFVFPIIPLTNFGKSDNNVISAYKTFYMTAKKMEGHMQKTPLPKEQSMAFTLTSPERCWIKYQLELRQANLWDVARKAKCNNTMVSQVLHGRKNSERVKQALADVLGYPSFDMLLTAYRKEVAAA